MAWLPTVLISNALSALVLGLVVLLISRCVRKPALTHALWILVLLKLVTPPLVKVPLYILPTWHVQASRASVSVIETPEYSASTYGDVGTYATDFVGRISTGTSDTATDSIVNFDAEGTPTAAADRYRQRLMSGLGAMLPWLALTWLAGSVIYLVRQLHFANRIRQLIRASTDNEQLNDAVSRLAARVGLNRVPKIRTMTWVVSPMLWGIGPVSVIVFPDGLRRTLDQDSVDSIVLHELAHYQRGDQWVRVLELAVTTLFWWHPVVWLALREIEASEEQCCDAWVVNKDRKNRRRYAVALLDTVDFLSGSAVPSETALPAGASGLGRLPLLRQRLRLIMRGSERGSLSSGGRMVLAVLLVALPLHPHLLQGSLWSTANLNVETPSGSTIPGHSHEGHQNRDATDDSTIDSIDETVPFAEAISPNGRVRLVARRGYDVVLEHPLSNIMMDYRDKEFSSVAFSPNSEFFVAGSRTGAAWLFHAASGNQLMELGQFGAKVSSIAFSQDSNWIALSSGANCYLIDTSDFSNVQRIDNPTGPVQCVRFSPDASQIVVVDDSWLEPGGQGRVTIWNRNTMSRQAAIACPQPVGVADFRGDGMVVTAEWDGTIRQWSAHGREIETARAHQTKDIVSAASFSPDAVSLETLVGDPAASLN